MSTFGALAKLFQDTRVRQEANGVFNRNGGLLPKPAQMRFPIPKLIVVTSIGLYLGIQVSKFMATELEEFNLYIPEDDE